MSHELIQIRHAKSDDLDDVQFCAREAYTKYIDRIGREPAPMNTDFSDQIACDQVYIAECEELFTGYVIYYVEKDCLHLDSLAVLPEQTGKGIGKKLIQYVEQAARDQGLNAVELYTNEAMTENLVMYPKLGYVEIERKQQAGFNRVFYRKEV